MVGMVGGGCSVSRGNGSLIFGHCAGRSHVEDDWKNIVQTTLLKYVRISRKEKSILRSHRRILDRRLLRTFRQRCSFDDRDISVAAPSLRLRRRPTTAGDTNNNKVKRTHNSQGKLWLHLRFSPS